MVCKEEVFNWFKELSGAKRIELMCGLMSMCIPLEIRFFEAIVRDLAKKDLNALREAEIKANSFPELDTICKCDLLADKAVNESMEMKTSTNCEVLPSSAIVSNCSLNNSVQPSLQAMPPLPQSPQVMPIQDIQTVSANGSMSSMATNEMIGGGGVSSASSNLSLLPSRSKLIVSLCLLSPTNRSCSTLAYKALRHQLTAKSIANIVMNCYYRKGCYNFDDLFSEILLLLTMALHHPAFSFEQRDILAKQKDEVELTLDGINAHLRQTTSNYNAANAHHFQPFHPHQSLHTTHPQQQAVAVQTVQAAAHSAHTPHTHAAHTHHQMPQTAHQSSQQYSAHTHQYMPGMPVNVYSSAAHTSAVLPNMSNLRISSMTSPVSTPSPTNSPSSKGTATSVAAISPLPITADFGPHVISLTESVANPASYVLTTGLPPHQSSANAIEEMSCVKTLVSCYNCGNLGHRGDECTAQTQDEANR